MKKERKSTPANHNCRECGAQFFGSPNAKWCSERCAFFGQVDRPETGCWEWRGNRNALGYGMVRFMYGRRRAHRVAYEIYKGAPGELMVCHACDNPPCCNPEHLFLGDQKANMEDMSRKARGACGQKAWKAKLTDDDVRAIRSSPARGCDLAAHYGVSRPAITRIRKRVVWKHVE